MILKDKRQKLSLTTSEIAEIVGVSEATISYYENYQRFPNITKLTTIQMAYRLSDEELLEYIKECSDRK